MRALLAIFATLTLAAAAVAGEAPRRATIGELVLHPKAHFDQRLLVTGVVTNETWGPDVCEMPTAGTSTEEGECIDLHAENLPFRRLDRTFDGAIIEIVGFFTHRCFPDAVDPPDGMEVEVVCVDRGGNGWITAESARVVGAVSVCPDPVCETDTKTSEVALSSPEAAGIDALAISIVAAVRRKRPDEMLSLMLPSLRGETMWLLERGEERTRDWLLPRDLALAPASATEPGRGYRLVRLEVYDLSALELCFCTTADCSKSWAFAGLTGTALRRLPFRCFGVHRTSEGWRRY
jgi:hypothetical protein